MASVLAVACPKCGTSLLEDGGEEICLICTGSLVWAPESWYYALEIVEHLPRELLRRARWE